LGRAYWKSVVNTVAIAACAINVHCVLVVLKDIEIGEDGSGSIAIFPGTTNYYVRAHIS
jgi:hypothetical protein